MEKRALKVRIFQVAILLSVLGIVEALVDFKILNPFWYGRPYEVMVSLIDQLITGFIFRHLYVTLTEVAVGFILGVIFGTIAGLIIGINRFIADVVTSYMIILNAIPKAALAPLLIAWFGIGIESKIALIVMFVFFVMLFNTYAGVRSVDKDLLNAGRVLGANEQQIMRKVVLPSVVPFIMAGIKLSIALSFVAAVVGEFLSASEGMGYVMNRFTALYQMSEFFATLLILLAVVGTVSAFEIYLEKRMLHWRPEAFS